MHSIIGIKKLKLDDLVNVDRHNMRLIVNEDNVDYTRSHLNRVLLGGKNPLRHDVLARIADAKIGRKIRPDAVYGVEFMLTASPEFFTQAMRNGKSSALDDWVQANLKFISDECGAENILQFVLHMDESTPHIQCVLSPIVKDPKTGENKLTAKPWTGSGAFARWHTRYGQAMGNFGLQRGQEDSPNTNQTIKVGRLKEALATASVAVEKADKALQNAASTTDQVNTVMAKQNNQIDRVVKSQEKLIREQRTFIEQLQQTITEQIEVIKKLLGRSGAAGPVQGTGMASQTKTGTTVLHDVLGTDNTPTM